MTYKCIRTCYFNGRLYEKGVSADFTVGAKIPEHFVAVLEKQPADAAKQQKMKKK